MIEKTYSSLHNHTQYSNLKLIDSINREEELIDYAIELGLSGVAITDHDCLSGHLKALDYWNSLDEEKRKKCKLILGNEIYLCREGLNATNHQKGEPFYHLILLAKDNIGHEQLRQLSSRAWERSYMKAIMRTPTYSSDLFEIVGENPGHLVCSSACLAGTLASYFKNADFERIEPHIQAMTQLFGEGNYFIELQPSWGEDQINYNRYMIDNFAGKYPFILTTDSHYLKAEDRQLHKWFLQSKEGEREVDSFYASTYMMSYDELKDYFCSSKGTGCSEEFFNKMCTNTQYISDQVEGYSFKQSSIIPHIKFDPKPLDEFWTSKDYTNYPWIAKCIELNDIYDIEMLNLMVDQWKARIIDAGKDESIYLARLNYELEQIMELSAKLNQRMSNYFITMKKMIDIMWDEADTLIGPSRGSAGSSIINYILGITQIDPLTQPLEMPSWRFLHKDRVELADIDVDSEASKRNKVFNKLQEYFQSIGGDLVHVSTFGTEGSKSAIKTAARGLDINEDVVAYLNAMIPNERGFDWTLKQCYYGDADRPAIKSFKEQMDKYPDLWRLASKIEGLITRLGCHASGVLVLNNPIWKTNSFLKTSKGILVTGYELHDSEATGTPKYDELTVQALDKIHTCVNLMMEDDVMNWQGTLRNTYNKYLHPDVINYTDKKMWDDLCEGKVPSCFQFDTPQGSQAVAAIHPHSLAEISAANGVMRLMPDEQTGILPMDEYVKFKNNINLWYDEMKAEGLTLEEQKILEPYLLPVYGVCISQECMMRLAMDEKISGFSVKEANVLRKAVAKKKADVLTQAKDLFYEKGMDRGTRLVFLNYVWNKQFMREAGYAFSDIHAVGYSYIALQEMNLCHFYPSIYWKCACLSVDANAINEEDYYNLVDSGIVELTDDEDKRQQNKVQYGKMAKAVMKFRKEVNIELPDINVARMGFTPDVERNSICFGLRGITKIGENIIREIILNRPYKSLDDFLRKLNGGPKKIISKDKVVNLIKAGCFDVLEQKPREEILRNFIKTVADHKQKLNLQNFQMLINYNMLPSELEPQKKIYNFTKYIRKTKLNGFYLIDDIAYQYLLENGYDNYIKEMETCSGTFRGISITTWDGIYTKKMDPARAYIKAHEAEMLEELNDKLFQEEYNKYANGDLYRWELDSLNIYYSGHPLTGVDLPCGVSSINDLRENDFDGSWLIKGKIIPKYKLRTILGSVIDKDKLKGIITLSTPDGVIDVKVYKQEFARYSHKISEIDEDGNKDVLEDSFFEKGTFLAVTGILKDDTFYPKVYKDTGFDAILKVELDENGQVACLIRKSA